MKRKFIEYDLPLATISEESAREKNIRHGHPSTLHIWWARRPLASSRATAFAALIDDPGPEQPEKRAEIMKLIEEITPWEAVKNGNSDAIRRAQQMIAEQFGGTPPKVLDPFAGGGSIPLEALRLGCETYASDYNPVAVFIEKATLEWPQKFGREVELPRSFVEGKTENAQTTLDDGAEIVKVNLLAFMVERWANRILEEARAEIGRFYPTESADGLVGKCPIKHRDGWIPVGYLWARTIPCQNPTCGAEIPLIGQFWLAKKKDKQIAYRLVVDEAARRVDFELLSGAELKRAMEQGFDPGAGTISRGNAQCPVCQQVVKNRQLRTLAKEGHLGERMVAVVLHHPKESGKKYRLATEQDRRVYQNAAACLQEKLATWPYLDSPLPDERINPKRPSPNARGLSGLTRYGLDCFSDLFNTRQQLVLVTLLEKIRAVPSAAIQTSDALMRQKGYQSDSHELTLAVTGYGAVILSRMTDYTSRLARWVSQGEFAADTHSRQALTAPWDYFENNAFSGAGGEWSSHTEWVLRYIKNNRRQIAVPVSVSRSSATGLALTDASLDTIFTDSPYYDNVPYADISDYFYVWLKRLLGAEMPELFSTPLVPKADEAVMQTSRHGTETEAKRSLKSDLGLHSVKCTVS